MPSPKTIEIASELLALRDAVRAANPNWETQSGQIQVYIRAVRRAKGGTILSAVQHMAKDMVGHGHSAAPLLAAYVDMATGGA